MTTSQKIEEAFQEGALSAARTIRELQLPLDTAVDVYGVIERSRIWLFFQDLDEILGAYIPGPTPGILVNSARPFGMQRLTASHELGHHRLGHGGGVDDQVSLRTRTVPKSQFPRALTFEAYLREVAAQSFAIALLGHAPIVYGLMDRLEMSRRVEPSAEKIYELSLHLGLSYEATAYRLVSLNALTSESADVLSRVAPARLKRFIGHGQPPRNRHRDVWPLRYSLSGLMLKPRVGDEIAVTLTECPSTGYRWTVPQTTGALELVLDQFRAELEGQGIELIGESGQRRLTFRVAESGDCRLALQYSRSWLETSALKEFDIRLSAEEMPPTGKTIRPQAKLALLHNPN